MALSDPSSVGAYDAKTHFSELLEKVQAGEEITITKHGTPIARLVPVKKTCTPQERRAAIAQWKKRSQGLSLRGLKIADLIAAGRR